MKFFAVIALAGASLVAGIPIQDGSDETNTINARQLGGLLGGLPVVGGLLGGGGAGGLVSGLPIVGGLLGGLLGREFKAEDLTAEQLNAATQIEKAVMILYNDVEAKQAQRD